MDTFYRIVSLNEVRRRINTGERVTALCGAGVSMIAPTCLPSGNALRDACVSHLLTDRFSARFIKRLMRLRAYQSLLPEAVLQDISSVIGKVADRFIANILRNASSNAVHAAITETVEEVFTTNFDVCFEDTRAQNVFHLHGSIKQPQSLQYRVFQLGKTSTSERTHFQRRLPGSTLLVIGYSFRDMDVINAIRERPPKEIVYLSLDGSVPVAAKGLPTRFAVAQGSAQELFGIPAEIAGLQSQTSWANATARKPSIQKRALALMKICARAAEYEMAIRIMETYRPFLRGKLKLAVMCEAADTLRRFQKYNEAEGLATQILESRGALNERNAMAVSTAHIVLGLCHLEGGRENYGEIEHHFKLALEIFEKLVAGTRGSQFMSHDDIWRARIFNNLGLLFARQGKYRKSVATFRKSCGIKQRHHDSYGYAQSMSNMAKTHALSGQFEQATKALLVVVNVMEKTPDVYICKDAISDLLLSLRENDISFISESDALLAYSTGEEWWRDLQQRVAVSHPNREGIISVLCELRHILASVV